MTCPQCGGEYREGIYACADCEVPLGPTVPGFSFLRGVQGLLRRLPPAGESALVLALCLGPALVSSLAWTLVPLAERVVEITDEAAAFLLGQELICLALAAFVLGCRGWRLTDFDARPTWKRTVAGFVLFLLNLVSYYAAWYLALWLTGGRDLFASAQFEIHLSLALAIALSVVNAVFEELVVIGYLFKALPERYGVLAIFLSAALRTLYHAYQGPIALVAILPMGLLFGFTYYRLRSLWPLILAHGIMDLVALT
jgi:membrane protease YdiL (CAAX protease family)